MKLERQHKFGNDANEKKRSERRKHCALAVVRRSQIFSPRRRPLLGSRDGQNLIIWRWSLPLPIQTQFGEDRCTQFRVIVVTDLPSHPPTPTHTHRKDRLQYTAPQLARSVIRLTDVLWLNDLQEWCNTDTEEFVCEWQWTPTGTESTDYRVKVSIRRSVQTMSHEHYVTLHVL